MNILYTVDDAFVPQLAAGMCSIFENDGDARDIDVYVFGQGISDGHARMLDEFAHGYGRRMHLIDISNLMDLIGVDFDTKGWKSIVLARLVMARLLPADVHRILYLDGDTIVRRSLQPLWDTDFEGNTLCMVAEPTVDRRRLGEIGLAGKPYYNAGVLFVDLDAWRTTNAEHRLLDCIEREGTHLFANDQDAINIALAAEIKQISPAYNYANTFDLYPYRFLAKLVPAWVDRETFDAARRDPAIIHYLGEERPWRRGNTHRFRDDYLHYLALTPFSDAPLEEGWTSYFRLWNAFNVLTHPFPALRLRIITTLIPVFIRHRQRQRQRNEQGT